MVASEFQIPNASVDPDYNIYVSGNQIVNYGSQKMTLGYLQVNQQL